METGRPIRILSVEDHPVFVEGLSAVIGSRSDMLMVAHAANAREGIEEFRRQRPDVTLMDHRLPDRDGTSTMAAILAEFPQARIVMLTGTEHYCDVQRALQAGAAGYVLKSAPKNELLAVIEEAHAGKRRVPAEVAVHWAEHLGDDDLSKREVEVLELIRDGHRNKQIAGLLGICEATVNFHIRNLVDKLKANDRTHAVTLAVRRGFLQI